MSQSDGPAPTQGFGNSPRRLAIELGVLGGGLLVVVLGLWWLASSLADIVAERLPISADRTIGEQAFGQLAPAERRCENPRATEYVKELAAPLLEADESPFEFEFVVLDDPEVNAFALPGGFVAVNRGLIEAAESGEEIAAVLAHELAHVTRRHGTKRVVRQMGTAALLSLLFGGSDLESLGYAAGALVDTAYDRDQEADADSEGQRLLRAAGISPLAMGTFFARLAAKGDPSIPTLLSTHPDPGDRSERAKAAAAGFVPTRTLPTPAGVDCDR
jgi:predicted Zn-dependent protease